MSRRRKKRTAQVGHTGPVSVVRVMDHAVCELDDGTTLRPGDRVVFVASSELPPVTWQGQHPPDGAVGEYEGCTTLGAGWTPLWRFVLNGVVMSRAYTLGLNVHRLEPADP